MATCPRCGQENPEGFKFCGACGASLAVAEAAREVRKTVTVVFCDVTGSTALGEQLDPESLRRVMARYFDEARTVLERHGGTVEKFIGDAVMAVFGVPVLHEDDALRAVRASIELRDVIRGLDLTVRIGVNTGEVVAGEGGTLVTGDAVNVAARLEQSAPPGNVLIGGKTYDLVQDAVFAEPLEPLSVKGKSEPVPAFRLVELLPEVPAFMRPVDAPFVGRSEELETLKEVLRQAVEERSCRLGTIVGPPGIGKSRLARELVALAGEARILVGRCLPYGEGITYWPLVEVVREAAGSEPEARIRELVGGDEADEVAARIAGAIGAGEAAGTPEETAWAFRRLFEALARERPLIVAVDDIHWAEPTMLDLLEYVLSFTSDAPIFLLCLARPDLFDKRPAWATPRPVATLVTLQPLSEDESEDLVDRLLRKRELADHVRARIVEAAEGNPLFVEQLLAMIAEDGAADDALAVPPTIQALLAARIDRLESEERSVIERASVEGRMFHRGAVAELLPEAGRPTVGTQLMSLIRKEFIRPDRSLFSGDDGFRFGHILIRDAAYESVSKQLRAELHERYESWLERQLDGRVREYEEILGYHLEQAYRYRVELDPDDQRAGELGTRAAERLGSAGRRAFTRGDDLAAIELLDRAVALLPKGEPSRDELRLPLIEALAAVGKPEQAQAIAEALAENADARGDPRLEARAQVALMLVLIFAEPQAAWDQVQRVAERAIGVFGPARDEAGLAKAWRLLAWLPFVGGQAAKTEEALERAVDHARRAGDRREESWSLTYLGEHAAYGRLHFADGVRRCDEILERASGVRVAEAELLVNKAHAQTWLGDFDGARVSLAGARAIAEDLGAEVQLAWASHQSGILALAKGDLQAAERELRHCYGFAVEFAEPFVLARFGSALAHFLAVFGDEAEAERVTITIEQVALSFDRVVLAVLRGARARLFARQEKHDEAIKLAQDGVSLARESDWLNLQADSFVDLAQVLRLSGRPEEAGAAAEDALRLYEEKGNVVSAASTRALLAELEAPRAL